MTWEERLADWRDNGFNSEYGRGFIDATFGLYFYNLSILETNDSDLNTNTPDGVDKDIKLRIWIYSGAISEY